MLHGCLSNQCLTVQVVAMNQMFTALRNLNVSIKAMVSPILIIVLLILLGGIAFIDLNDGWQNYYRYALAMSYLEYGNNFLKHLSQS